MNKPERIYNVSHTQFSVARHFGGCTFNGASYHYDAENDVLVRMDVWKALLANDKAEAKRVADAERKKWTKVQRSFAEFLG